MPMLEDVKRAFERLTGYARPRPRDLPALVRQRKPQLFRFKRDGSTPNNTLPLVLYRSPVLLADGFDPAALFEELFAAHGWRDSWRNGMYDYLHFHTHTHEVLGIARGRLRAEFGGSAGRVLELKAGDVVVLPAGTGHRRLEASSDLLVVGAYPARATYDEPQPGDIELEKALHDIARVTSPAQDPVYGKDGPLVRLWRLPKGAPRAQTSSAPRRASRHSRHRKKKAG